MILCNVGNLTGQESLFWICDNTTKESLIWVNVFSQKEDTCFHTDINGIIELNLFQGDTMQFEYTGYKIMQLTTSEMQALDTIFMKPRIYTDPLSNGINIIEDEDKAWTKCKCCKH